MVTSEVRQNVKKVLLAAGMVILWFFLLWKLTGFYFELNDDRCIGEILSGTMAGKPEARTVYMNYLLGLPLSLLYRITAQVPWYGGMLVLCHLAIYTALMAGAWSRGQTLREKGVYTCLIGCLALADIYMTSAMQYTSGAALMAAAGYGCLILEKKPRRGRLLFFFFQLAACLLRVQAMLLMQPLGAALCAGMYLTAKGESRKERCKKLGKMLLMPVLAGAVGLAGFFFSFPGQGWKDYHRFNRAEEEIFDYYGQPEYDEVKPILDKYGVTRAEYTAYCNYVIMDWDISIECAEELAEYVRNRRQDSLNAAELFGKIGKELWAGRYLQMNRAAGAAWAAALLWMFFRRRFRLAAPLAGLALGRTAGWAYLVYADRLPYRVTLPLFAAELILLVCLLIKDYEGYKEECAGEDAGRSLKAGQIFALLLSGVFAVSCVLSGKVQYGYALDANAKQKIFTERLAEVGIYCDNHAESRYLLDTQSFMECCGSVLETRIYGEHNYAYTGTWYSNSPGVREYLREYLEEGKREFYLIVRDDGAGNEHYGVVYLAEKLGREPEEADRIVCSNGGAYLVWAFR